MIHNKFRYLLTLVALFAISTGAWAQATFGVKEITADMVPADWNGDNTIVSPEDLATLGITFFEVTKAQASAWADYPKEGTVRLLYAYSSGFSSVDWYNGTPDGDSWNFKRNQIYNANATGYRYFVTVAPAAAPEPGIEVTPVAEPAANTKQWTFTMPGSDVELIPEYYPGMLTLGNAIEGGKLEVVGMTAPFTKLEVLDAWEDDQTLLSAAHLPGFKEMTDAQAENWTGAPKEGVANLFYGFDGTYVKLAYYTNGECQFTNSVHITLSQLKNATDEEFYYSSEAQMPVGFEKDEEGNIYVADKTEFQVKAVPAEGYRLVSLMFGETDVTDKVDADGIATVTMPEGENDITLTATFSNEYNVALNAEGLSDEEAAAWKAATGDKDPAALPLEKVKYGTEVKVSYTGTKKVIGVKAAKKKAGKTITIGDVELIYADGDTWETIVSKNPDKIKTLSGRNIVQVEQPAPNQYRSLNVWYTAVKPSDIIDPSKNYQWGNLEVNS